MTRETVILIVEDSVSNLQLLEHLLAETGYRILTAVNGKSGVKTAVEEPPDLILLDIIMPGMDGYQVCERLKAIPETRHIPIIFLTARRATEDVVRGFKAGAVDYVFKPFEKEELLARVHTHVLLKQTIADLRTALAEIKTLKGLLPICSFCRKIRDDQGYWKQLETYFATHSDIEFSYSLCPECARRHYPEFNLT